MAIPEEVIFEGGPHTGDLVINTFVGATLVGLPLFIGSLVRRLWVRYRITNRRITVTGGWLGRERSDIVYAEIAQVITVPRGLGSWGDMVLTLKDGTRLEMRAIPRFRELYTYITERLEQSAQRASGHAGDKTKDKTKDKPKMSKGSQVV